MAISKRLRYEVLRRELTAEEEAEFRGLFFGEGHLDLSRPSGGSSLVPRLRLAVRDDDFAIAEWCRSLFGGSLSRCARTRSVCWQLTGKTAMAQALRVLDTGTLPSKKRREVTLLAEAIGLVPDRAAHIKPAASRRLHELREELKAARAYPEKAA